MNEILWLSYGFLLAILVDWLFSLWRRIEDVRGKSDAAQVLKKHGLTPQLYLPTIGEEDPELRSALDTFAFTGHVITNPKGDVVGKLCPTAEKGPPTASGRVK